METTNCPENTNRITHVNPLLFEAVIYVASHYAKKNAKTIRYRGRKNAPGFASRSTGLVPYIANTIANQQSEHVLVFHLSRVRSKLHLDSPICYPLHVVFNFFSPNWVKKQKTLKLKSQPPLEINARAGDLDNIIQGPLDALVKARIITDDSIITDIKQRKIRSSKTAVHIQIYKDTQFMAYESDPPVL